VKRKPRGLRIAQLALAIALSSAILAFSACRSRAEDTMLQARHLTEKAQQTLETFANSGEMAPFRSLIRDAQGVFISPQVLKGAFIFGASGGSGVFVARDRLRGQWAGPAFYTIGGVSFGFQIGGSASEIVLLAMTERGVNALLESSFKLGADVGVAVGPVGMGAAASTANLSADILSFSRSKGLYGGISVDGAVVKTRGDLNDAYYRTLTTPLDIFAKRSVANPHAGSLLETVARLAGGKSPMGQKQAPPREPTIDEERAAPSSDIGDDRVAPPPSIEEEPLAQ
jgi:SH3 domain-containing YSC84-like protein 1